jgi:hypothetical protein
VEGTLEKMIFLPDQPLLSGLIWLIAIILAMYAARKPFLQCILTMSRLLYNSMRLSATSLKLAEKRLQARNRDVLINAELEMGERRIAHEFEHIGLAFQRHMEGYTQVQRKLIEDLTRSEEDHRNSAEVPQALPDYTKVIEAVANIKPSGDRAVVNILEAIHQTLAQQHKSSLERFRCSVAERHAILNRMVPLWRGVKKTMRRVDRKMSDLDQRAKKIDHYMDEHKRTICQSDAAIRRISASSLKRLAISTVVLAMAAIVAIINYNLLAMPMSEMMGVSSYIGNFKTSDVAAFLLVSLQVVLGFFLMDALGVTRLFSVIGSLEEGRRNAVFWVLCCFIILLAALEASLALLLDRVATQMVELRQELSGENSEVISSKIALAGQMIMGFILPVLLTFVAIPFESFVTSLRTLLGILAAWSLRSLAFGLRLLGNLSLHFARMAINVYDLVIFPALWVEGAVARRSTRSTKKEANGQTAENAVLVEAQGRD